MNSTPDEHPDYKIRQALDSVSHTLPPDTSYTPGRGWDRMRAQLAAPPAPQPAVHRKYWWRVAAMVLFGVGLGVTGLLLKVPEHTQTARTVPPYRAATPAHVVKSQTSSTDKLPDRPAQAILPVPRSQARAAREAEPITDTLTQTSLIADAPRQLTTTSAEVIPEKPAPAPVATTVATRKPVSKKRYFEVIHENELPLAEEAYRVRNGTGDKPERLVRIGSGASDDHQPNQPPASLSIPLNRKTP